MKEENIKNDSIVWHQAPQKKTKRNQNRKVSVSLIIFQSHIIRSQIQSRNE